MNKLKIFATLAFLIILSYGLYRAIFYDYVKPDEIGVWMTNGGNNGISDYKSYQGTFPVDFNPLTRAFKLPAQPWTIELEPQEGKFRTYYSQQKGEWRADPQATFKVDRAQAPLVCFRNNSMLYDNSKEAKEKFLESVGRHMLCPIIHDVFVEIIATRSDSLLMSNTFYYQKMAEDSVRARFRRVGYELETFVSNLNPPETIIAKNRAKNESEAAAITAKSDVIKAEAEAKVKVATAKADSEAMLVQARANAEATRLQQQATAVALNPLVIQKMWIDKWDGALPYYQAGSGSQMFQIPMQK